MTDKSFNTRYLYFVTFISAMGGLLFGYDWVVIGGAKPFYEKFFNIAHLPAMQGWTMSSALVGCLIGAVVSGFLSDRYGRKRLLILTALVFIVSAVGTGAAQYLTGFILYRILGGIAIGLASNLSPMYIAEISPARFRGRFVSLNQLTIVIGILAAQIVNWMIADRVPAGSTDEMILNSWNGQWGWRWMFWAENVPATAFFLLMFTVPESPRWLVKNRNAQKAMTVLLSVFNKKTAEKELENIGLSLKNNTEKLSFKALTRHKYKRVLIIGLVLAVFQQWSGINVIFNYAEEVFAAAGYDVSDILFNIVITGSVNLIFTLLAIRTVDRWGRRKLMLTGAGGIGVIYLMMGAGYHYQLGGWPMLLLVVMAIAFYALTLAPVTWVILSEIFPNRIRGLAMSAATVALWSASFLLTYTFPVLNDLLNASGTFWFYALICLAGFVFIFKNLPETKNKSLEELEQELVG